MTCLTACSRTRRRQSAAAGWLKRWLKAWGWTAAPQAAALMAKSSRVGRGLSMQAKTQAWTKRGPLRGESRRLNLLDLAAFSACSVKRVCIAVASVLIMEGIGKSLVVAFLLAELRNASAFPFSSPRLQH